MVLQDLNKSVQLNAPLNRDLSDRRNITRGRDTSLMSRWTMPQFAKLQSRRKPPCRYKVRVGCHMLTISEEATVSDSSLSLGLTSLIDSVY